MKEWVKPPNSKSARVAGLWNELDDSTVSADNVRAFNSKLGKMGY